ncbi:hypothetical protein SAY86_001337 [Trapa natans]|uniref:Uncharacterized protein n=1 Tax=Trapa natans TaxID=22666 RepID=A0AAN7REK8_TRANT|nr:hypothetical protein SAY86_001337 [Trapa natans]
MVIDERPISLDLKRPRPVAGVVVLLDLSAPLDGGRAGISVVLNVGVVLEEEGEDEDDPLKAEDEDAEPSGELEYDGGVLLPHIGLEAAEEVAGSGEDEHRDGALKDGGQDGGHHVGGVPLAPPSGGGGAARDGADDGESVEEDEKEAADGGEEAEGESEEDAARGSAQEDVVAEEEHFVGVRG